MGQSAPGYTLNIVGTFRLARDSVRIDVSSKRGQALLALLATAGAGERTRAWLQDRLWGSRGPEQAQASLRRELSNLRKQLNGAGAELLAADHQRVWFDLTHCTVDWRSLGVLPSGDLLEGLEIPGEDGFEDWLRDERQRLHQRRATVPLPLTAAATPPAQLDPGFSERPAIAVLPFGNATGDPAHDLLAEGLAEDLIDRLARLRWLPVIARGSSFALGAGSRDIRSTGQTLGARYVLDGQVRKAGTDLILAASLGDAVSGATLWSNRITLPQDPGDDAFIILLDGLTSSLDFRIDMAEQRRALQQPQGDRTVRDLLWRGRWHLNRWTRDDAAQAEHCFEQALALDPTSSEALIQYAWVRLWTLWATRGSHAEFQAARQLAQQAIVADYDDARGYMLAGTAESWMRQPLRAEALLNQAIQLNPSLVMAHVQLGCVRHLIGDHERAIAALERALQLSPNDQDLFFTLGELARANLHLGQHDQALQYAESSLARRPGYWLIHVIKINALVRLNRMAEAGAALAELRRLKPDFDISQLDWLDFMNTEMQQFLRDGLNRAAATGD